MFANFEWNPVMVPGDANGNGRKRLIEPYFTLGTIVIILGAVYAFYDLKGDFRVEREHGEQVKKQLDERSQIVDSRMTALQTSVDLINALILKNLPSRYSRDDANHDFGAINGRLDSMEKRLENVESRLPYGSPRSGK